MGDLQTAARKIPEGTILICGAHRANFEHEAQNGFLGNASHADNRAHRTTFDECRNHLSLNRGPRVSAAN
jgi:hypothetical protein